MSRTAPHIDHIALLTPGNFAGSDPRTGLENTLRLFELAEHLGFDSAWVRQRHLEPGVSSASVFLAAASQRTRRIELGTAVIQMGYENPFRLAEDLATVDVLSGGRLNVGVSAGPPALAELLGARFLEAAETGADYSHRRVARLAENLRGDFIGGPDAFITSAAGRHRPRLHPHAEGLRDRLWYGGGSLRSAAWAGQSGFNLLIGNISTGEGTDEIEAAQLRQLDAYHAGWSEPREARVALGRVIVPTDGADERTRRRYREYADSRRERTLAPQGERRTLFAPDLVGSADEILDKLSRDRVLAQISELRLELPYNFELEEYEQIVTDFVSLIAPELGWVSHEPRPVGPKREVALLPE
jgi:alkanesulfonate monooxygenase SsuD/methylene tetrahydromethanopterin reductase-like flavin-dependent oxidoreductase (luciferase family)